MLWSIFLLTQRTREMLGFILQNGALMTCSMFYTQTSADLYGFKTAFRYKYKKIKAGIYISPLKKI